MNSEMMPQPDEQPALDSKAKWRGFFGHLGPYIGVITLLAIINFITNPGGYPWFIWPALGWGVGIAFHLMGILASEMKSVSGRWRGFLRHFGSYAIIMGLLISIYLMTNPGGYPWFIWPALGWGVAVAIHLWGTIMGRDDAAETAFAGTRSHTGRRQAAQPQQQPMDQRRETVPATEQPDVANQLIQEHLDKADSYRRQINELLQSSPNRHLQAHLQDLAAQVQQWTEAIGALARRVDSFQRNNVIQHDLASVPQAITKLEEHVAVETDPALKAELERTLTNRRHQWTALQNLEKMMKQAEVKIESTLSSLGTLYSQMLISQSTDQVANYGRLSEHVDEEVRTLQDHLEALEEVKLGQATS